MMINFIKKKMNKSLLAYIHDKTYKYREKNIFYKRHGYKLNINNPQKWSEKIQYRKKNGNNEFMATIADKYLVREYVKNKIGNEYLIPILGVYDNVNIDIINELPNQFVIKTNHGSGSEHIEIVKNKDEQDLFSLINKLNSAVNSDFGGMSGEKFYSKIERKIIIEEYLISDKTVPDDFKFHCFNNDGSFTVFIQVDTGRYSDHKRNFYDENWNFIDMKIQSSYEHIDYFKRPEKLDLMLNIAKKLSEDFDYVRVDLYNLNGKIYFGEITQTHGSGLENFEPTDLDSVWGDLWILDKNNRKLYNI